MALTICPDCSKKISTRSEHCIYCGCPSLFFRDGESCEPDSEKNSASDKHSFEKEKQVFKFYTIREAAKQSGLPEYAVRRMVKCNEIPFITSGVKVLINSAHLQKYIEEH